MKCWARNLMACGAASLLLWGLLFIWFFICEMVNLQTYGCFSCCIFPFWTHGLSPVPKSRRDCLLSHLGLCLIEESVVWGPWTTVQILGMCLLSVDEFMNQRMSHFHFPFRHYYSWLPDITLPTLPNFLLYPILFIASMFVCYSCLLFAVWNLLSTFFWLRWFLSLKTWLKTHVCPAHILCAHSSILFDFDSLNSEPLRCQQASMISPWMEVLWVFFLCVHLIFMLDHSVLKNRGIPLVLATWDVPKSLTWSMEWNPCCAEKFVWDKEETPCGDWLCGASASLWSSWLPGLKADLLVHFRLP